MSALTVDPRSLTGSAATHPYSRWWSACAAGNCHSCGESCSIARRLRFHESRELAAIVWQTKPVVGTERGWPDDVQRQRPAGHDVPDQPRFACQASVDSESHGALTRGVHRWTAVRPRVCFWNLDWANRSVGPCPEQSAVR